MGFHTFFFFFLLNKEDSLFCRPSPKPNAEQRRTDSIRKDLEETHLAALNVLLLSQQIYRHFMPVELAILIELNLRRRTPTDEHSQGQLTGIKEVCLGLQYDF